jgi:hypothetical protein
MVDLADQSDEFSAAVFVVIEHVVAGTGRAHFGPACLPVLGLRVVSDMYLGVLLRDR